MNRGGPLGWVAFIGSLIVLLTGCHTPVPPPPPVEMTVNGAAAEPGNLRPTDVHSLVLGNGLLALTFGPDANGDFSAISVVKNGRELAHNLHGVEPRDVDAHRSFYLDANAGRDHLVADMVRIVKNTPELAHFAVVDNRALHLEHHFVMLRGESGVHPYVVVKSAPNANTGETRTMYRFDMDILDWAWTNERTGRQPKYAFLQSISAEGNLGDETWRLPDGTVYQKYDYSLYYADSPMWGHYGHGYGVFFMPVSTESYAGGPLRQELAVHQDALILNYIGGGHYGGGGSATGRNGEKIHGPWFLYFNTGATPEAIIADAKRAAAEQKKLWPYRWMDEPGPLYPRERTTVTGQLKISHDRSAANAYVILGQPNNPPRPNFNPRPAGPPSTEAGANVTARPGRRGRGPAGPVGVPDRASVIYTQSGDYIFSAKTDASGKFTLPAVRPGTYTLYAWQTQGPIAQSFAQDEIKVDATGALDLGVLEWDAPYHPNLIFQIGQADRMAGEFKFGSAPRSNQWMQQVPTNLTFTVGQSKAAEDWYYAQPIGTWKIKFDVAKVPEGNAYLTIPVAGGLGNIAVLVNEHEVGKFSKDDDASVRRAANRSGVYARFEYTFPASYLRLGENIISLQSTRRIPNGSPAPAPATSEPSAEPKGQESGSASNNGLMYDTIVLESD